MYILLVYGRELSKNDYLGPLLITIIKSIKKLIKKNKNYLKIIQTDQKVTTYGNEMEIMEMTTSHVLLRSVLFSCFLLILRVPREFDDVQRCVSTQSFDSVSLNQESLFYGSTNECLLWFLSSWDH